MEQKKGHMKEKKKNNNENRGKKEEGCMGHVWGLGFFRKKKEKMRMKEEKGNAQNLLS